MLKITLKIDGMACGMCEAHVNDAIRKAFSVKKVTSSHSKGRTEILVAAHTFDALDKPLYSYDFAAVRFLHIDGVRSW